MTRPNPIMAGNVVSVLVRTVREPGDTPRDRDGMGYAAEVAREAALQASPGTRAIASLAEVDSGDGHFLLTVSAETSMSVDQWRDLLGASLAMEGIEGQWDSATVSDFLQEPDAVPPKSP